MVDVANVLMDRTAPPSPEQATAEVQAIGSPTVLERWLLPLMWVAIGVVAAITTPEPLEATPLAQTVTAEILGWAAFVALVGMIMAAIAARHSLRAWSAGMGVVGLIGLASCQMFGHPVFSSAWGLSQVGLVGGGLALTGRFASRDLG